MEFGRFSSLKAFQSPEPVIERIGFTLFVLLGSLKGADSSHKCNTVMRQVSGCVVLMLFILYGQMVFGQNKPIDISGINFNNIESFVEYNKARISGQLRIDHHPERITGISVQYGRTMEDLSNSAKASFDLLNGFSAILSELEDGVLYYYCVDISVGSKHIKSGINYFFTFSRGPVDLDLPSGNLWASYNVGASLPTEDGDYFAWGETSAKDLYSWTTYKYCAEITATSYRFSKYTTVSQGQFKHDNQVELRQEDDAACSNMGIGWCIPTSKDWKELLEHCILKNIVINNVRGLLISSREEPNNFKKTIFLSSQTGYMYGTQCQDKSSGLYWSSNLAVYPTSRDWEAVLMQVLGFNEIVTPKHYNRCFGLNVRAVLKK